MARRRMASLITWRNIMARPRNITTKYNVMPKNNMARPIALVIAVLSTLSTPVQAKIEDFYCPSMYVGADAQIRSMKFQEGFGSNIYKRDYPQGNFYVGIKGNEFIGIEAGYEFSKSRTRSVFLPAGSSLLGIPQPFDLRQNVITKFQGLHTSLIGFFPIWEDNRFNLILAAGVVNLRIQLENVFTQIANVSTSQKITLSQSKNILRLMTGFQFMFNPNFGTRANVRWENTSQFQNIEPPQHIMYGGKAKARNSVIYGLGFFFQY